MMRYAHIAEAGVAQRGPQVPQLEFDVIRLGAVWGH